MRVSKWWLNVRLGWTVNLIEHSTAVKGAMRCCFKQSCNTCLSNKAAADIWIQTLRSLFTRISEAKCLAIRGALWCVKQVNRYIFCFMKWCLKIRTHTHSGLRQMLRSANWPRLCLWSANCVSVCVYAVYFPVMLWQGFYTTPPTRLRDEFQALHATSASLSFHLKVLYVILLNKIPYLQTRKHDKFYLFPRKTTQQPVYSTIYISCRFVFLF